MSLSASLAAELHIWDIVFEKLLVFLVTLLMLEV